MANNWYIELMKAAKTDPIAQDLVERLKNATTNEEKEKAKQNGKNYIESTKTEIQTGNTQTTETTTSPEAEVVPETLDVDEESVESDQDNNRACDPSDMHVVQEKIVEKKYDMSEPAFNPRLAKMGITREEELFKMGVYVRKLTRDEKIQIRRSIYQKKKSYMSNVQTKFKAERAQKLAALEADPEYQKFQQQRKYVLRIVEALKAHCNVDWMLQNIEGLTVDVIRELLKKPANVNAFKEQKDTFVPNFYKRFGE